MLTNPEEFDLLQTLQLSASLHIPDVSEDTSERGNSDTSSNENGDLTFREHTLCWRTVGAVDSDLWHPTLSLVQELGIG